LTLPLIGIKVLDFTHLLPGEVCSTVLADLGCEVMRIEPVAPGLGSTLPPIVEGESLYYWSIHRNKMRLAVDLKSAQGKEIAHKLVRWCDALVENFRPGVMQRLGVSYDDASRLNPGIVYCSISGYGQETSWSNRPGHDLNFIAESGVLDSTRLDENGRPALPGALISDYMSALYGALGVVSALFARQTSGQGRHIDISMFESALSTQQIMATALSYLSVSKKEANFRYPSELPHYSVYECKDGRHIAIAPLEKQFWKIFCQTTGMIDLIDRHAEAADAALFQRFTSLFKTKTLAQWMETFEGTNCCISPVNTIDEALRMVPAVQRAATANLTHPTLGAIPQIVSPMLSKEERKGSFKTGQGTDSEAIELLSELGYTNLQIAQMRDEGVIALRHGDLP
jgi:alpha-methylacyl-CoA racemase